MGNDFIDLSESVCHLLDLARQNLNLKRSISRRRRPRIDGRTSPVLCMHLIYPLIYFVIGMA